MSNSSTSAPSRPLRLGTRGSPLALAQAHMTAAALRAAHGWSEDAIEIVTVKTSGDRIQDRPLADIGGKALWTKELDRALTAGEIDFAVHSMKDVETIRPDAFRIAAMLPRADVRDRLIGAETFDDLPAHPLIGTSSPRRAAQVKRLRPDATITLFRGNVATRLAKLAAGEVHATLLAAAGLERLKFTVRANGTLVGEGVPPGLLAVRLEPEVMLPAVGQAAVGIEVRERDDRIVPILEKLNHVNTHLCVRAERALLRAMGGGCASPIAAYAEVLGHQMRLRAISFLTASPQRAEVKQPAQSPEQLGEQVAMLLKVG